jgi:hypothetical protein
MKAGVIELQSLSKRQSFGPDQSEDKQRDFFCAAMDRTLAAELKAGVIERFYSLAGCVLSLKFAGDMLARCFAPALAHLEIPPTSYPDATFHIWDSKSTGTDMVPPPCPQGCFTSRGDIWSMGSPRFKSAYLWSEYALTLFDTVTSTGMYWTRGGVPLPNWAEASPLRCLLQWWAETKGFQLVHAAAIGREGRAVLITGRGGVGKSTTALSCLGKGLNYIGDDYVLVRLDPVPSVHSLYCTAKLNWDQMGRFPQLADLAIKPGSQSEKAVMYLYPEMKGQIASSLPLQTVVTPCISNRLQTELGTISPIDLQRATAFTTMSQLPHASQHTYHFISRLIAGVSRFQLVLGTNLDNIAEAIVQLLRRSGSETPSNDTVIPESINGPLISIIMLVHNGARLLPDVVASVLAQNHAAIEIIVVDNGSSDHIDDAVCRLPVAVRFFKQRRVGRAAACNRGIREASGEFISFLDVGDLWPEGTLQTMLDKLLVDNTCDVVQGFGRWKNLATEPARGLCSHREILGDRLTAAIYRRKAFRRVGLFDQDLGFGEENDWYNRARRFGVKIRQVNGVMLLQRREIGETLQELNALREFKHALDQKRETDFRGKLDARDSPPSASG